MVVALWSAKGGAGVTVCAVGAGLATADAGVETLLVDARGDVPAVCGVAEPAHGIWDWAASAPTSPAALGRIEVRLTDHLSLLGCGERPTTSCGEPVHPGAAAGALAQLLLSEPRQVVVDLGRLSGHSGAAEHELATKLRDGGASMLLVTRACYLSLRLVTRLELHPDGIVVVREAGRALQDDDLAAVIGAPVVASIDIEPAVSRSVDAGLLLQRRPRPFLRSITKAVV